ncbi:hypothetical protein B0H63DRAFT_531051 [Podospora didyma]|uniref:Uncharacterized protein n=1 Tax=Podospora didyma TaxID=330526 RepID=A0AAE0P4Z9_9PEZI|nr:hypothetical protein B0H63DRAFT_531051 [Podospora didyma]
MSLPGSESFCYAESDEQISIYLSYSPRHPSCSSVVNRHNTKLPFISQGTIAGFVFNNSTTATMRPSSSFNPWLALLSALLLCQSQVASAWPVPLSAITLDTIRTPELPQLPSFLDRRIPQPADGNHETPQSRAETPLAAAVRHIISSVPQDTRSVAPSTDPAPIAKRKATNHKSQPVTKRLIEKRSIFDSTDGMNIGIAIIVTIGVLLGLAVASIAVFGFEWKRYFAKSERRL